jgi:7,8-dihydropterin-6-yl-methyl-4-(beta-D-ribofuranosyl)aminobenzene 5'-phosphate synthase
MRIRILYDDAPGEKGMIPAHGFSCLIEKDGERVLFDTGGDCIILFKNASHVDINNIEKIVISHAHWDHMGSLLVLLPFDSAKKVYFPSATESMKREIGKRAELIADEEPIEVAKGIYTTGLMGEGIKEQSLVIKEEKGLVIITGCAHPGVGNIIERARDFGDKIYALLGGLHDFDELELLRDIELIVPCHCTVEKERILKEFNSIRCGVGTEIEV